MEREQTNCNDYVRLRQVKAYISDCLQNSIKTPYDVKRVCAMSGYKKQEKFLKHLNNWINLKTDIPIGFLRAIGAENEVIFEKLEADKKEFEKYKNASLTGAYGVVRIFAGIYQGVRIPENYSEEECINYVASKINNPIYRYVIHFKGVKSIWVEPKKARYTTTFYDPDIKLGKASLLIRGTMPEEHYKDDRMFGIAEILKLNRAIV